MITYIGLGASVVLVYNYVNSTESILKVYLLIPLIIYDSTVLLFLFIYSDGGYDIQDFYEVNAMFGSNQDLEDLFAKARELGLKIILDFVPNHTR